MDTSIETVSMFSGEVAPRGAAAAGAPLNQIDVCRSALAEAYRQLAALNRCFIAGPTIRASLPHQLALQFERLDPQAKQRLAELPIALFVAPFGRAAALECAGNVDDSVTRLSTALTSFAWHMSRTGGVAFRTVFGVTVSDMEILTQAAPLDLIPLARRLALHIAPRWADHAYFWPQLIRSAAALDRTGMQRVVLLGRQLIAAEFHGPGASKGRSIRQRRLTNAPDIMLQNTSRTARGQGPRVGSAPCAAS